MVAIILDSLQSSLMHKKSCSLKRFLPWKSQNQEKMKKWDLDSKLDSPVEKSDFLTPIPWKQMSYFWSARDLMSSWCHFMWTMEVLCSPSADRVTQVEAQSTEIPQPDPCILCCCAARSCHPANWHKKEPWHLAESTFCQIWGVCCKEHFAIL